MSETFLGGLNPAVQKVTRCEGCKQHRGCAKYLTMWLCVTRCWRRREGLYKSKQVNGKREAERAEEQDTGKVVHRHRKRPKPGQNSGAGAYHRR